MVPGGALPLVVLVEQVVAQVVAVVAPDGVNVVAVVTAQLATLGYVPSDVDSAILSHLHQDHIGGLPESARHHRAVRPVPRQQQLPAGANGRRDQAD